MSIMEDTQVEHPWDQQQKQHEDFINDEQEEDEVLLTRKKNIINGASNGVLNGKHQDKEQEQEHQEHEYEQEELDIVEEVKEFNEQNGIKVDEDEEQKQKEYSVYYDKDKENGLHCEPSVVEEKGIDSTTNGEIPEPENSDITTYNQDNGSSVPVTISNQNGEHEKHNNYPEIESIEEVNKSSPSYIQNKSEINEIQVVKDGDDEITEFDVETVLKKQDTHDLFCPNCNSRITKRVILRKRKRRIPVPGEDAKRNKPEKPSPSEENVVSDNSGDNQARYGVDPIVDEVQPLLSNENDYQREPDVFRCLSCFSIFMPTGNGFKLFQMFGNKSNEESNQSSQKVVPVKKNWFSNFFASDKVDQGAIQSLDITNNIAGVSDVSSKLNSSRNNSNIHTTNGRTDLDKMILQSATSSVGRDGNVPSLEHESDNGTKETNVGVTTDSLLEQTDIQDQLLTSYYTDSKDKSDYPGMFVVQPPDINNVEPAEISVSQLQHDGLMLAVPPNVGSLVIDNSQMNQELDVTVQTSSPGIDEKGRKKLSFSPPASMLGQSSLNGQMNGLGLPTNMSVKGEDIVPEVSRQKTFQNNAEIRLDKPLQVDNDVLTERQINLLEDLKNIERINSKKGKDTIITIENKQLDASSFQTSPDTPGGVSGTYTLQQAVEQGCVTTTTGGSRSLDMVKGIVYGGLMEAIASLSVVASAAGANAATLNVLALGLANIFGGLLVISHDLWDLKNERTRKNEDRYQQLLGRRADFPLHMVVSLLSYLIFGFLPPVVYGFSFRESNDRDFKLLTVAAASIVCIMILATGKAYVQSPRKSYFQTIAYYVVFGFMVSGSSYVFGGLIIKLLEKIDIFHSGSVENLIIQVASSTPDLATY